MPPIKNIRDEEVDFVSQASIDKIFATTEFELDNREKGKYIWKVEEEDEKGFTVWNGKRLKIQLTYNQTLNEITGITLKKFNRNEKTGEISINNANLAQIQEFLNYIKKIDLRSFVSNRVYLNGNNVDNEQVVREIKTLLDSDKRAELIKTFLEEDQITNQDLVNTGYRKKSLEIFRKMLCENDYIQTYKSEEMKNSKTKDETAWQHFFENNEWIFGYGLDYRFVESSNREVGVGYGNVDFISFNKFTVLIETKTPNTPLIKTSKNKSGGEASPNRADAWSLSNELIDAVSQVLAYKANWQSEFNERKNQESYDSGISNYTADPKTILIVGRFSSLVNEGDERKVGRLKQETFELFRRDSRNIEILTYDELIARAYYIVYQKKMPEDFLQNPKHSLE